MSKRRGRVVEDRVDTSQYRLRDRNSRLSRPIAVVWIIVTPMVTTWGWRVERVKTDTPGVLVKGGRGLCYGWGEGKGLS